VLVVVAFGIVVLGAAALLGTVVASVVLAAAVTAAFDPLADRLRAGGRSSLATAGLVTLTAAGLGIGVIVLVVVAFLPATADLVRALRAGLDAAEAAIESGSITPPVSTIVSDVVTGVSDWLTTAASAVLAGVASTATILLLAFFLLFFMVTDADRSISWMLQAAADWQRARIAEGVATARRRLGRSLRETALRAAALGAITLLAAIVLGLPAPLALGVLVFLGGFIPLLGPIATTAFVGLVALGSGGLLAATVAIGALVATTIFLPRILGPDRWRGHGIHPGVVLVALTIGGVVGGPLGMVLGVPVAIVLRDVAPSVIAALNGTRRPEPHEGIVPRWLDRLAQWSWRLLTLAAVTAIVVAALVQVPLIVIPLVLASVAAATLAPGAAILLRRGLAPTTASMAMTAGGFGLILVILVVTLTSLAEPLQEIVATAVAGAGTIDDTIGTETLASVVEAIGPQLVEAVAIVIAGIAGLTISIVLGAILTFYLLRDGVRALEVATRPLAPWRQDELEAAAGRATSILGNYMIGTGAISAVGAASQFLIMSILGIPLAWPLAILSFFGGFIPYIGSLLTTLLAFLVTVAVGSTQDILIMAIFTLVFNIVQGNIVAPLVYGRAVSIHPAIVLLAIPAGAAVAGIAGMFLAVPVIGVVATTWRTVLRVFGSEPADRVEAVDHVAGGEGTPAEILPAPPAPEGAGA
jgi:predicted PurR-regulated permease PerM